MINTPQNGVDIEFFMQSMAKLPGTWQPAIAKKYEHTKKTQGRKAANLSILDTLDAVSGYRFGVASDDEALIQFAKERAQQCEFLFNHWRNENDAYREMAALSLRYEIPPPSGRNVTLTGAIERFRCPLWWRRNVRKIAARNVEAAAIKLGMVSRKAGLYASDEALKRRTGQRRRNAAILKNTVAVNDAGQEYSLAELSALGTSNPEIRRMELMTRIAGFDEIAFQHGHAGEFLTITAPSKYHARDHKTGEENKKYNGATPTETQRYLGKVWARIRAKLKRDGLGFYGFRVAEPHHDGTPHWHMIIFCEVENVAAILATFKHYALEEDGGEFGARKYRFNSKRIDRSKGSAVGYIAKYISKNIDGNQVGEDYEAEDASSDATKTARRVDAWAATWGIRQFQQVGGQSVTVWRELRRAKSEDIAHEKLKTIVEAADAGKWKQYTELTGGVLAGRGGVVELEKIGAEVVEVETVEFETGEIKTSIAGLNKYGEHLAEKIIGFKGFCEVVKTHLMKWIFKRGSAAVSAGSSVNNCTQAFKKHDATVIDGMKKAFFEGVALRPKAGFLPVVVIPVQYLAGFELSEWELQHVGRLN